MVMLYIMFVVKKIKSKIQYVQNLKCKHGLKIRLKYFARTIKKDILIEYNAYKKK